MTGRTPTRVALLAFSGLIAGAAASAHNFTFTDVELVLSDGSFRADVHCDLDALALGVDAGADSASLAAEIDSLGAEAREDLVRRLGDLLRRRLRVRFDGKPVAFEVTLPERGSPRAPGQPPSALGLLARLS